MQAQAAPPAHPQADGTADSAAARAAAERLEAVVALRQQLADFAERIRAIKAALARDTPLAPPPAASEAAIEAGRDALAQQQAAAPIPAAHGGPGGAAAGGNAFEEAERALREAAAVDDVKPSRAVCDVRGGRAGAAESAALTAPLFLLLPPTSLDRSPSWARRPRTSSSTP